MNKEDGDVAKSPGRGLLDISAQVREQSIAKYKMRASISVSSEVAQELTNQWENKGIEVTNSNKNNLYLSIDIETDGPVAGLNNMLTFGAAAFDVQGIRLDTFYVRLCLLPYLHANEETMQWWSQQSEEARAEAFTKTPRYAPLDAMKLLNDWVIGLDRFGTHDGIVPMAWPAVFDFPFIKYYLHKFLGRNPLGFACLDIRSYLMGLMRKRGYYDMTESECKSLFGEIDKISDLIEHVAVDDAIEQGRLFFHIRNQAALVDLEQGSSAND